MCLVDDARHQVQPIGAGRGVALKQLTLVRLGDNIGPQPLCHGQRVRHGFDLLHRGGLQLVNEFEYSGKVSDQPVALIFIDFQASQPGYMPHIFACK